MHAAVQLGKNNLIKAHPHFSMTRASCNSSPLKVICTI